MSHRILKDIKKNATSSQPKRTHRKSRLRTGCVLIGECEGRKYIALVKGQKRYEPRLRGKQFYSIPTGGVEDGDGENLCQTAVREFKEETGFDISRRHLTFLFKSRRCTYFTLRLKMKRLPRLVPLDTTEVAKAFWRPLDSVTTFLEEFERSPMTFCNKDLKTFFVEHLHSV